MSENRYTRALEQLFDKISQDSARHARQEERQKRKRIDDELRRNVTVRRKKRREGEPSPHSEGGSSASTEESEDTLCGICFENYTAHTIQLRRSVLHKVAGGSSDLSVAMMSISPILISGLPQIIALATATSQTRRIRPPRPSEALAGEVCGQQVEW